MGNSDSREVMYNWEVKNEDINWKNSNWNISKSFGFPNDNTVRFYVFTSFQQYLFRRIHCIKIKKVGFIDGKADIAVQINNSELKKLSMINWKDEFSSEFIFDCENQPIDTIICTIKLYDGYADETSTKVSRELACVKNYFLSPEFSDITLRVDNEEFPAHKIVLACNSPVFKKMLNTDMKEKRENCININEFDAESIKEILRFLYGKQIEADIDIDFIFKLSSFADMYQVYRLRDYCELKLIDSFEIDNIVKILITVDNYDMEKVKNEALTFMMKNKANISFKDAIDNVHKSTVLREFFSNLAQMKN